MVETILLPIVFGAIALVIIWLASNDRTTNFGRTTGLFAMRDTLPGAGKDKDEAAPKTGADTAKKRA